jgi:NtrC-family two-component system sensor histidine kinase KinB
VNGEIDSANDSTQQDENARLALFCLVARELINIHLDVDSVLRRVLMVIARAMDAADGGLYILGESGDISHRLFIQGGQVQDREGEHADVGLEKGLVDWVMQHRQGALVANTAQDERWRPLAAGDLPRSAIAVPLPTPIDIVGVLTLVHEQPGYFTSADLVMLAAIADQMATAIVNARLYQAEQRRRHLAATLAEISQTISATLDLDRLFDVILEQLARVVHYDSSLIFLQQGGELRPVAYRGFKDPEAVLLLSYDWAEEDLAVRVMRDRQTTVVDDVQQSPGWRATASIKTVRGWIGAPLITKEDVLGVLVVNSSRPGVYTPEDAQVATTFAHQAAIALANARMVEQLQAAEARYARLFEDSTDIILIIDLDGRVLDANHKACELLGCDKTVLVDCDVADLQADLRTCFEDALPAWSNGQETVFEVDLLTAPGRVIPLEFCAKLVDYGSADAIQWNGRDVAAQRELAQLHQDLTNMILHDLRGPMGNLLGAVEIIPSLMGQLPPESALAQVLDIALRSGQQMHDLVDSMLDVSRLERGRVPLKQVPVIVNDLLRAVEDQVSPMAQAKQIELSFDVRGKAQTLRVDHSMIRRVLVNLVDNAIKYSPHRRPVRVVADQRNGDVIFSVIDRGPGIPLEQQGRIFEKFVRLHHQGDPSGIGLGLAFCRLAVEAHGGHIWVESAPDQGSSFSFMLPVAK